jgi:Recombinase zinc beta ribbon domain
LRFPALPRRSSPCRSSKRRRLFVPGRGDPAPTICSLDTCVAPCAAAESPEARCAVGHRYYRCQGAKSAGSPKRCTSRMVKADWLEAQIWEQLSRALQSPGVVAKELQRQLWQPNPDVEQQLADVKRQLQACARYETQLVRLFGFNELDEEAVRREGQKNKQRRVMLEQRQQALEGQLRAVQHLEDATVGLETFCARVSANLAG